MLNYLKNVLKHQPPDWLDLTTHRLDIYNESLAKVEFIQAFENLAKKNISDTDALANLPTAYDYIRLGHPLSSLLEWVVAQLHSVPTKNVISFGSTSMPLLAILRKNLLANKKTRILYTDTLPEYFDSELLKGIYGYSFELEKVHKLQDLPAFNGSTVLITDKKDICHFSLTGEIDFFINFHLEYGSIILVNTEQNDAYIAEIQHVRRRETIAMTPANCNLVLKNLVDLPATDDSKSRVVKNKAAVLKAIKNIVGIECKALVGSSGLSIQYAILMGLIHDAAEKHPGKDIKIIVPPNCYGGTNDQARRVAACIHNAEVLDLPVDGGNDMSQGINSILEHVAELDAVPFIIAEIPTNPRVEVPDLNQLQQALGRIRQCPTGEPAVEPVFILDQTFCPNVRFLRDKDRLAHVRTISYVSGSKFPSGGKCTSGYCVGNKKADSLMQKIETHLKLCDNQATPLQLEILAEQMPSMNQRIQAAYENTRELVNYIQTVLPDAKINFVSEALASQGFTPSVFSLDLPSKGKTTEEKESYKRSLNHKLIHMMITEIPKESKYCVSYGQLKGCYWTIPATSTQGTTKEDDKDYIVRVAVSPDLDLERHKQVFLEFTQCM
ncbi:MAG: PLP-dependent transferase [Gammaproteobacteria bacterium]|nr:PLP-dependent transferase [Gammaproteobacteria bacterium]